MPGATNPPKCLELTYAPQELAIWPGSGVAVVDGPQILTYRDFRALVNALRHQLGRAGVRRALLDQPPGPTAYAALWACYLENVTAIPIYMDLPQQRIRQIMSECEPDCVINADGVSRIATRPSRAAPSDSQEIAYILYTSGSTGTPKGVRVLRDSVNRLIPWSHSQFQLDHMSVASQFFQLGFDLGLFDVYAAISAGSTLVPFHSTGDRLRPFSLMASSGVTHWHSTPTVIDLWRTQTRAAERLTSLRALIFCGEPLRERHISFIRNTLPHVRIYNNYGPTEATMFVTSGLIEPDAHVHGSSAPLGEAVPWSRVFVDGDSFGELIIEGSSLADGYLGEDQGGFVLSNGRRLYRSGDLVEVHEGQLYYHARKDRQVKVRGYRVDLSEIENAATSCGAHQACAIYESDRLHLYVAPITPSAADFQIELQNHLPQHLFPITISFLADLPTTSSDKIDRATLTEWARKQ